MGKSREIKPRYRCCVYDLEAEQLFRNLKLQTIKSYGDSVTLEDGTVLHKEEQDPDLYTEINEDIHEICDMPLAIDGYFYGSGDELQIHVFR